MDAKFYEFLSQLFVNMAQGQKQLDDVNQWFRQGDSRSDALPVSALFQKAYGLDGLEQHSATYLQLWKTSSDAFQKSLGEYLALFDVVPRKDHETLRQECDALKKKVAEQEETIRRWQTLQTLLSDKGLGQEQTVDGLQELIRKQSDQFQELMKGMGQAFKKKK
jgi:hypothetical protein